MFLELTDPGSNAPVLLNTHWVAHWFPHDLDDARQTLVEMAYVWISPDNQHGVPEARTLIVAQSYDAIMRVLMQYQGQPDAVASLHRPLTGVRRRRRQ
jgi:hypothetical protein